MGFKLVYNRDTNTNMDVNQFNPLSFKIGSYRDVGLFGWI